MRILVDFEVKEFDDDKADAALELCQAICIDCEKNLENCMLNASDCPVKNSIEALSGMIRTGRGIKRYKEIGF